MASRPSKGYSGVSGISCLSLYPLHLCIGGVLQRERIRMPEPKLWQRFIAKSARKNSTFFEKNPLAGFDKLTAILQPPSL